MANMKLDIPRMSDREMEAIRWLHDIPAGNDPYRFSSYDGVGGRGDFLSQNTHINTIEYRFRPLIDFLEGHYTRCAYFNGFSIGREARPYRDRDNRNGRGYGDYGTVLIGCSCGERISLPMEIWKMQIRGMDLEDCIEDMNYQAQGRSHRFNMKEMLDNAVQREIAKRESHNKSWARDQINTRKRNIGVTFGLEIQDT